MTSCVGWRVSRIFSTAATMKETSGSFVLRSGVGTQMFTVSVSRSSAKSVLARSRPEATSGASSASGTSMM